MNPWTEVIISNFDEYHAHVTMNKHRAWIYRGQSDASWPLTTSLHRWFSTFRQLAKENKVGRKINRTTYEKILIEKFQSQSHLYCTHSPDEDNYLEWLSIMQHYGTPTRLLDFTFSPYIAAFFALENGTGDCTVFAIKYRSINKTDALYFGEKDYKNELFKVQKKEDVAYVFPYEPIRHNERLAAQQGLFLVPSSLTLNIDKILNTYPDHKDIVFKYIIKKNTRLDCLNKLRRMNISSATLFPGMDGFSRSLRFHLLDVPSLLRRIE